MEFDFDREIDRRGTDSVKWDLVQRLGKRGDTLPLWVADMDFPSPQCVIDALQRRAAHGIFGYSAPGEDYYEAVAAWFRERFGWETQPEWLVRTPGVVFAISAAVRALTEPGDAVLVLTPVYYPFYRAIRSNGRALVESELLYRDGRYEIDFADVERKVRDRKVKMCILCSPHNPVCRVWTREELRTLGDICGRYGVTVVSDEIHCDFAFPEHPHTMFPMACPELADRTVVCTAPSKTFNLAGLQTSNIWIPDGGLRRKLRDEIERAGGGELNAMGLTAAKAAYEGGGPWLEACRAYLRGNLDYLRVFLRETLPEIRLVEPDGTYFAWLDCSALGLDPRALDALVSERAGLWLDAGEMFGEGGAQFQRMVLACTRRTLAEALRRLERAVHA